MCHIHMANLLHMLFIQVFKGFCCTREFKISEFFSKFTYLFIFEVVRKEKNNLTLHWVIFKYIFVAFICWGRMSVFHFLRRKIALSTYIKKEKKKRKITNDKRKCVCPLHSFRGQIKIYPWWRKRKIYISNIPTLIQRGTVLLVSISVA